MVDKSVLTPQEVAEILKITKNTVYELIKRGELNAYKVGKKLRIDTDDLEAYKNRDSSSKGFLSHTKYKLTAPAKSTLSSGEEPSQSSGFVICGQDAILDILSRYLELHPSGTRLFAHISEATTASMRCIMVRFRLLQLICGTVILVCTMYPMSGGCSQAYRQLLFI